ncbi:MAG: UDP-N-acetylglucosamine diphosphorylase [Chlamydiales bacterium]|nr:UDP-N-acetylglucosamine diphosphorylase [Chlamydiales bacterium]
MSKQYSPDTFFDLTSFEHKKIFEDCQHAWDVLKKLWAFLNHFNYGVLDKKRYPGVFFENESQILVGQNTVIEPTVFIKGPCIIGNNCEIRHGAYLRGCVILGDHCIVGHSSEIVRSLLLNHAKAPHFNYVGDSVIGNNVNLGAGFITANLKLDEKEIYIFDQNKKVSTGLKKFGAIVADNTKIGCNSVSNPGTIFYKNAKLRPCLSVTGFVK